MSYSVYATAQYLVSSHVATILVSCDLNCGSFHTPGYKLFVHRLESLPKEKEHSWLRHKARQARQRREKVGLLKTV